MSELIDALNQLQKEKHIEKEVIMQAIEDSLVAACNRDFGKNAIVKVNMDRDTGDISVYVEKTVVEEVEDPATEISLADAKTVSYTHLDVYKRQLSMNPKAFAIGVRVEHPAHLINESQYGEGYPEEVPTASYKLTHQCKGTGRGIYSFCMCPGGYVVNSSSEKGRLCVNGMSYHDRAGHNSNTALITTVTPDDFPSDSPLAGLEFQRK